MNSFVGGFAASRAESLKLSVGHLEKERLRLAAKRVAGLTESQRLSAREAAKPQSRKVRQADN